MLLYLSSFFFFATLISCVAYNIVITFFFPGQVFWFRWLRCGFRWIGEQNFLLQFQLFHRVIALYFFKKGKMKSNFACKELKKRVLIHWEWGLCVNVFLSVLGFVCRQCHLLRLVLLTSVNSLFLSLLFFFFEVLNFSFLCACDWLCFSVYLLIKIFTLFYSCN